MPVKVVATQKLEGAAETLDALKDMSKATQANILRRVLIAAGEPIAAAAKGFAPRGRTGLLELSISVTPAQPSKMTKRGKAAYDKKNTVEVLVEAGPIREAVVQEFGTVHMAAHPYMRPAWNGRENATLKFIGEQMWIEIDKAAARAARKAARIAAKAAAG